VPRITLESDPLRLELDPAHGCCLTGLWLNGPRDALYPILRPAPAVLSTPLHASCYLLAPWSNRVNKARFRFQGEEYALKPNFAGGHAIHGDVHTRPWTITDRTPVSARMTFDSASYPDVNYPFAFACVFRALVEPTGVRLDLSITNRHDGPIPVGLGFHPFFMRQLWSTDDKVELCAPVQARYPHADGVPTGPAVPNYTTSRLSGQAPLLPDLDDCFSGFQSPATIKYPASGVELTLKASKTLTHLVCYTPTTPAGPIPWFCVEPVTIANDGFNLLARGIESGTVVLDPGETLESSMSIGVRTT